MTDALTLKEVFSKILTVEAVAKTDHDSFCETLISLRLIKDYPALNLFILEHLQKALIDGDEFPISYYGKDQEVQDKFPVTACLSDEKIEVEF